MLCPSFGDNPRVVLNRLPLTEKDGEPPAATMRATVESSECLNSCVLEEQTALALLNLW
jgi:hypothetical protein